MRFHVLTLFPEMIQNVVNTSILGRAIKQDYITVDTVNIRDFSANKHMRVDDYPYGGGAGMVMEAEPVFCAVKSVTEKLNISPRIVYLTPQGRVLNQTMVEEFAQSEEMILLCGHYEGIDERVLEEVVTDYVSIGDYVLTGGELGAIVMIDAISRFVPGVLSNEESSQFESLQDNLLEYPHYTRPEVWHEKKVPEVLLCGDHRKIDSWRYEQSVLRTKERRPDLLAKNYKVHTAYAGDTNVTRLASCFSNQISRYSEEIDLNRKKLRKQRFGFERNDLFILFLDKMAFQKEMIPVIGQNLFGKDTACVLFYEAGDQDEGIDELVQRLKNHGFLLLKIYRNTLNMEISQIKQKALEIRCMMDERE